MPRRSGREKGCNFCPDRRSDATARVGPLAGLEEPVVADRDVVEGGLVLPQRWRYKAQFGSKRRKQARKQRRNGARSSHNLRCAVYKDFVARGGIGVRRNVGHHAPGSSRRAGRRRRGAYLKALGGKDG